MRGVRLGLWRIGFLGAFLAIFLGASGLGNAAAARYRVTLTTLAPAEEVFERFGHTVLAIEDAAGPSASVYSFGTFDGDAPHQWHKALHKRLRYWVVAMSPLLMTLRYDHRAGQVQELALSDPQAAGLAARLAFVVRPENREYPYDLFTDNCVTRIRDLLDEALGGALRRHTAGPAPRTFRQEVLQTLAPVPLLAAVATLIYGPYTDVRRSRWDTLFLPEGLRGAVAELELEQGSAGHRLVRDQRRWQGEFWSPPRGLPHPLWGVLLLGLPLLYGLFCLARGRLPTGRAVLGGVGALLALLSGLVGLTLGYLETTPHLCFQNNANSTLLSPLSLIGVPLFGFLAWGRLGRRGQRGLLLVVSLAAVLPVVHLVLGHLAGRCLQVHGGVWAAAALVHAVLVAIVAAVRFGGRGAGAR